MRGCGLECAGAIVKGELGVWARGSELRVRTLVCGNADDIRGPG
jgi:hypothetical protein